MRRQTWDLTTQNLIAAEPIDHRHSFSFLPKDVHLVTKSDVVPKVYADVEMSVCVPADPMNYHFKNASGDECLFIHHGSGTAYTSFGTLPFGPKDYVLLPKGTIYRLEFDPPQNGEPIFMAAVS